MAQALNLVKQRLREIAESGRDDGFSYAVPGLWIDPRHPPGRSAVTPSRFFLERIEWIESQPQEGLVSGPSGGEWTKNAVIYNTLLRAATGYDHSGDGKVSTDPIGCGWMETGTFLKTIATLPLIKHMGFNTVHMLPVTAIGQDGHKGTLGSVYAIQNPYRLDQGLSEPALDLDEDQEFAALIEAAHMLGLRVVVEFVFRTASKDSDWVRDHPEWFYWIKASVPDRQAGEKSEGAYGAPVFTQDELQQITTQVERDDLEDLIPPHPAYRAMFTPPPRPDNVKMVDGGWVGTLADGTRVRVPGAFADWPPDDAQPPWTDVTYLRLYDHQDFNYIAYNTVRMYDASLATGANRVEPLWKKVIGVLPYYQRRFGIDGVMIDMGHALPIPLKRRLVNAARDLDPGFAFWDENFSIKPESREEGYNAVIGNYWWLAYRPEKLVCDMLRTCSESGYPLPFFAAPESHNTPRASARPGGPAYARLLWALGALLPALPFCHAGFEVAETLPANTGLDFEPEVARDYPPEVLPLFSETTYAWDTRPNLVDWIQLMLDLRRRHKDLITNSSPTTFELIATTNRAVWVVVRHQATETLLIVFNLNWGAAETFRVKLSTERSQLVDLMTNERIPLRDGWLEVTLEPAGCLIAQG